MMLAHPPAPAAHGVRWNQTPCPLCGSAATAPELEAPDPAPGPGRGLWFAVVRCGGCGLCYTNPRPDAGSIGGFYPADYKPHRRPRKMTYARPRSWWGRFAGRSSERQGELPFPGPGRLLDFGCGGGSFLKRMADQGWSVTGLDAAVGAVREVQESLGLPALVGSLPHPDLPAGSFDVVTMWHSLEHVHDPLAILREAFQLLIPGGKILVACPNIAGLPFRWFGPAWFGLDLPRHLVHFTPETLAEMLVTAGFQLDRMKLIRHSDWLRSSAKLAVARGGATAWQRALAWKPLAKIAAWAIYALAGSDCMVAVAGRPTTS